MKLIFNDTEPGAHILSRKDRLEWVESSFEETDKLGQDFLGVSISDKTLRLFFSAICAVFILFFFRALYLQVIQGKGFALLADRNKVKIQILPAKRGVFYDRNMSPLVWNVPNFSIQVTKAEMPKDESDRKLILDTIAFYSGKTTKEIAGELEGKNSFQPAVVVDNLDYEQSLKAQVGLADVKGVSMIVSEKRRYDASRSVSLSHVIGYTGRINEKELVDGQGAYHLNDIIGKEGLELSYEHVIHGKNGTRKIEVDALGAEKRVIGADPAIDGKNIVLALDAKLQAESERALQSILGTMKKKKGVVIITDPRNGGIRALVSLPAYDNTKFAGGLTGKAYKELLDDPDKPLFNRALFGEYPSGSTIKPLVAAAALQEKVVLPSTTVRSSGGIRVGAWFFPDWKAGGHGTTNVVKALAQSVNTYFYMVGGGYSDFKGLGVDRLVSYFKKFGIGEPTGIDVFGERTGFVPSVAWKKDVKQEPWYIGDTYHISIGQGDILVTPLQVNVFTQYFANGGFNYRPHFVEIITDELREAPKEIKPMIHKKDLVDKDVVNVVRQGMRETVVSGSARRLSTLPVPAAGKTGTAQWGTNASPHAWFTGWAPYDNPEIAITVLVEEGEEGSRAATPVAHEILKWYFSQKNESQKKR